MSLKSRPNQTCATQSSVHSEPKPERISLGLNLEYVRHADKSLEYGVKTAGQMGYEYVEPCFLMGQCLLSVGRYCHVTSLDTDPAEIRDLCQQAGVKLSALSSHSDLLTLSSGFSMRGAAFATPGRWARRSCRSPRTCIRPNG